MNISKGKIRIRITMLIIAVATFGGMMAMGKPSSGSKMSPERRLARHYYLSAVRHEAEGRPDAGAELFRKAYDTDSTYVEAALEYGIRRYGMPRGELSMPGQRDESRRIARKFIDKYPGDIFPNLLYSNVMEQSEELEEAIFVMERLREHNPGNTDILQLLSSLYLDVNEIDKALDALDSYARIEGEDAQYFITRAGMKLAVGDTLGTLAEADRLIAKNPADPSSMAFKARLQDYFAMPDSALASFLKAESMTAPNSGGAVKIQMADFYRARGDSVNYDSKTYEALLAEDLDFTTKRDLLAYYLQNLINQDGDRERGDRLFAVLLGQYPHEPELLSLAARYSVTKKDYGKALEEIDYALDLDHSREEYWDQALTYCLLADEYERGDRYFERAKRVIDPMDLTTYAIAGAIALMAENPERALDIYSQALESHFPGQKIDCPMDYDALRESLTVDNVEKLAELYQSIGDAYFKANEREHAFMNYDNSLKLNPQSPLTLNNYAYFIVRDGKDIPQDSLDIADKMSETAVKIQPEQPTYLDTRAWVLFRKGEYKEAKEVQLKALELLGENPDKEESSELFEHLGDILFMNHEPEEALKYWQEALEGDPDNELLQKKVRHKTFFYE